jgi:hypothetical protein
VPAAGKRRDAPQAMGVATVSWPAADRACDRLLSELFDEGPVDAPSTRGVASRSTFAELHARLGACSATPRDSAALC